MTTRRNLPLESTMLGCRCTLSFVDGVETFTAFTAAGRVALTVVEADADPRDWGRLLSLFA